METDMVLFMEKLPPEFIAGAGDNLSITDFQFSPPPTLRTPIIHFNNPPRMREMEMTSSASMAGMREMIFRIAAMQPVDIDPETVKPPKRRNVKISRDPQSVAARHRRERISQRIRILQRLVPGGTKMDTASMLDEAIHYVKFLKSQVQSLETAAAHNPHPESAPGVGFPMVAGGGSCFPAIKGFPSNTHHGGTGGFEHQYNNNDSWMLN